MDGIMITVHKLTKTILDYLPAKAPQTGQTHQKYFITLRSEAIINELNKN